MGGGTPFQSYSRGESDPKPGCSAWSPAARSGLFAGAPLRRFTLRGYGGGQVGFVLPKGAAGSRGREERVHRGPRTTLPLKGTAFSPAPELP